MTDEHGPLREQLVALMHDQWSGWLRYQWTRCTREDDGRVIVPAEWADRWRRQMQTAYAELPEAEKDSDRAEADRVLALLPAGERDAFIAALVQEYAALLAHAEPWQWMPAAEPGERDYFLGARHALERAAARLGVTNLHDQAADRVAREEKHGG
jgi:hypothetical protein